MTDRSKEMKEKTHRVVLGLPDTDGSKQLAQSFRRAGFLPHRTPTPETTTLAVTYRDPAAVLVDAAFLKDSGFRMLESIRNSSRRLPVIVVAEADDENTRIRSLMLGAEDCLVRPFSPQEAVLRVRRAVERRHTWNHLSREKDQANDRAERLQEDLGILRSQLRRNVFLLQRAVDFHQRLEPDGDSMSLSSRFLRNLSVQMGVARLAYMVPPRPGTVWMTPGATWGVPGRLAETIRLPATGELASLLEATGSPLVVERLSGFPALRLELGILSATGFTAVVPLLLKGKLFGVVLVGEARMGGTPSEENLRLAQFLASALVPAMAAEELREKERFVSAEMLGFLVTRLEAANPYLRGHSQRVAQLAEQIGYRMGLRGVDLSRLTMGALLHDVGRFEADAALWSKRGPLGEAEWRAVRRHPADGARILAEASWPEPVLEAVRFHHERWDGSGYPDGLSRNEIPRNARIVAVADGLEALTSSRPHREAVSVEEALQVLREESGTKYEPEVVEAAAEPCESVSA